MATIKFLLQSKSEIANIYIRFSVNRSTVIKRKTGFTINPKFWNFNSSIPNQKTAETKELKSKLDKLSIFIIDSFNSSINSGIQINGDWLQDQIDIFNNKKPILELDILINYIQKYIDEAPYKANQKKEVGLSLGRIQNLKLFKNTIERYQSEALKGKKILLKDVNLQFVEKYKIWLFAQNYSINYVGKNIANLKTICSDAFKNDFEVSNQLKNIKGVSESKKADQIIILSEEEQQKIKNAVILQESLKNARKWLLLGCLIGQRGGDLLSISKDNIKEINGIKLIEIKQQKTGKLVAIPLLPNAVDLLSDGFPYNISLPRFNEYIKKVCEIAGINELISAKIKYEARKPMRIETRPKFNFITSHVCRRSFATNFYGLIPTPVLMNITAHGTEQVFLKYIGKTTYDNAFQMVEYFNKLKPKNKEPEFEVIRNVK